ncbi:MAG: exodeoxyribonuclease VII small subunit [Pseudobdellovibrionaceae bacterium]
MDFEKKLKRLEEIVQNMEKGDMSLDASLKLFEEGVQLSRECQSQLTAAEGRVKILTGLQGDQPIVQDFKPEEL